MIEMLLGLTLALGEPPSPEPAPCWTSWLWQQVDESRLDQDPPEGTSTVALFTGCTFVSPPGAVIDVHVGARRVDGLPLVGIRRARGEVIVAATPAQAARLQSHPGTWTADVVRAGDWMALVEEVERTRREMLGR